MNAWDWVFVLVFVVPVACIAGGFCYVYTVVWGKILEQGRAEQLDARMDAAKDRRMGL